MAVRVDEIITPGRPFYFFSNYAFLFALNSSLAFSTSILDITNVMISVIATVINKYIVLSAAC